MITDWYVQLLSMVVNLGKENRKIDKSLHRKNTPHISWSLKSEKD